MERKDLIKETRQALRRLEEKVEEECRKLESIPFEKVRALGWYDQARLKIPRDKAYGAVFRKQKELEFYLSNSTPEEREAVAAGDEVGMQLEETPVQGQPAQKYEQIQAAKARVFNDVGDLLGYVFRESNPSTLDSRFDVSRPLTAVPSPLASPLLSLSSSPVRNLVQPMIAKRSPLRVKDDGAAKRTRHFNELMTKKNQGTVDVVEVAEKLPCAQVATSILQVKEDKIPASSPQKNIQEEMTDEEIIASTRLSKFKYWEYGAAAPGSDVEESAEEAEESPLKPIPQGKAMISKRGQDERDLERDLLRAEQQIAFANKQRPEFYSIDDLVAWAVKDRPDGVPDAWPVPGCFGEIIDQIMFVVPQNLLDFECAGYDKKPRFRYLMGKRSHAELTAIHKRLFEHHPRDLPLRYAGQGFINSARLLRANKAQFQLGVEDSGSENDMGKNAERIEKISKTRLAQSQKERPTPERKALTNAEKKRRQLWGTTDPEEAKRLKEERKRQNKEQRQEKDAKYRNDRRIKEKKLKVETLPAAPQE